MVPAKILVSADCEMIMFKVDFCNKRYLYHKFLLSHKITSLFKLDNSVDKLISYSAIVSKPNARNMLYRNFRFKTAKLKNETTEFGASIEVLKIYKILRCILFNRLVAIRIFS